MISKNLYSNLLKEDMKRRIWTLALAMLAFLIGLPIFTMLRIERTLASIEYGGIEEARKYFASIANNQGIELLFVITIVGAFICGLNGFSYLYSKSKVDLYHSIPVKREKLFVVTYMNGIFIYVIPYLINIVLYFIIGAANGLLTGSAVSGAISAFGINLLGYLLIYSITIIAVMMTGNLIVGILGTAIFMIYGPAILIVKSAICEIFFKTYYQSDNIQDQLAYVSPIFAYSESSFNANILGIIVVTVISIAIGVVLYKIRPSEAAGKSMAFKKTQAIIKILIVIPTAIVGGLLFMSMSDTTSFAWMLFGIVFIGFLAHGIIEIIYHNDFKCIILNKIQLSVCIILALGIAGAAKADLFQYDLYMPNANKVESMSIDFEDLDPSYEYYDFKNEYSNSNQNNYYSYVSSTTYRLDHMNITKFDSAYQLVEYAKENNFYETEELLESNPDDNFTSFTVKYTLKNKQEVYRSYTVKLNDIMNYANNIYVDESYKEGVYQILTMDRSVINSINYYNSSVGIEEVLKFTEQQKQEFLDVFSEELKMLTATELVESIPVTELIFQMGEDKNYFTQSYYVYPQYTNTIEYLKSLGANLDTSINLENIESITITDYNNTTDTAYDTSTQVMDDIKMKESGYYDQEKQYTFTDRDQIVAITKVITPDRLTSGNRIRSNSYINLGVSIIYKYVGNDANSSYTITDKLPDNILQEIGY